MDEPIGGTTANDGWSSWGATTSKDKKAKDLGTTKKKGFMSFDDPEPLPEPVADVVEENADEGWSPWGATSSDKKKKDSKSTKSTGVVADTKSSKTEDIWGSIGSKDKKGLSKSKSKAEPPPPVPTPPAQGLSPVPDPMDYGDNDFGGDTWAPLTATKSKASKTSESSKTLTAKEKLKKGRISDAFDAFEEDPPVVEEATTTRSARVCGALVQLLPPRPSLGPS